MYYITIVCYFWDSKHFVWIKWFESQKQKTLRLKNIQTNCSAFEWLLHFTFDLFNNLQSAFQISLRFIGNKYKVKIVKYFFSATMFLANGNSKRKLWNAFTLRLSCTNCSVNMEYGHYLSTSTYALWTQFVGAVDLLILHCYYLSLFSLLAVDYYYYCYLSIFLHFRFTIAVGAIYLVVLLLCKLLYRIKFWNSSIYFSFYSKIGIQSWFRSKRSGRMCGHCNKLRN